MSTGAAINFPSRLVIYQDGYPDISVQARYRTEPLRTPPYWNFNLDRCRMNRGWGIEATHHKLYLHNRPDSVIRFSISHGYNMVVLNRIQSYRNWQFRLGAGSAIVHPESNVRGMARLEKGGFLNWGYKVRGWVISLSAGWRGLLTNRVYLIAEWRWCMGGMRAPIANGSADVRYSGLLCNFGLGFWMRR